MSYYLCSPCCIDTPIRARDPMGLPNDFEGCNAGERHSRMVITAISTTQTAAQRRHWMSVYYFRFRIYLHLGVVPWILIQYFMDFNKCGSGGGSAPDNNCDLLHYLYTVSSGATGYLHGRIWDMGVYYNVFTEWRPGRGLNCGSTNTSPNSPSHTSSRNSAVLWSFCCRSCTDEVSVLKGAAGNAGGGFYAEFPRDALRVNEWKLHTSQTIFHSSAILFHHRRIFLADHSSLNDDLKYVQSRRRVYPSWFLCVIITILCNLTKTNSSSIKGELKQDKQIPPSSSSFLF